MKILGEQKNLEKGVEVVGIKRSLGDRSEIELI